MNRPGANITGITLIGPEIVAKRLALLVEMVPRATAIGVLGNPTNPITEGQISQLQAAARTLGRTLVVASASDVSALGAAFGVFTEQRVGALLVAADPFFDDRRADIVTLASRHALPASYVRREFVTIGGLMSYGVDVPHAFRQAATYTGRILNGEKVSELPVQQSDKFDLAINLKTAKSLGLAIPATLLA